MYSVRGGKTRTPICVYMEPDKKGNFLTKIAQKCEILYQRLFDFQSSATMAALRKTPGFSDFWTLATIKLSKKSSDFQGPATFRNFSEKNPSDFGDFLDKNFGEKWPRCPQNSRKIQAENWSKPRISHNSRPGAAFCAENKE